MKKYLRFSCTVCHRFTDKLVDTTHVTPDKCTITYKCEGRLTPVEYRSNAMTISPPVTGLLDWRARGTATSPAISDTGPTFIDTSCGLTQQVVLAVQLGSDPGPGSTIALTLNEEADAPTTFSQYTYRMTSAFSSVSGVESGLGKKTLSYTTADTVNVYLNGVQLVQGPGANEYQLYNGTPTSTVPPNTVNFNSQISLPGITQVDVIVSTPATVTQVVLTFNRNQNNAARLSTGSWENVSSVSQIDGAPLYLFTMDLSTATGLTLNTILIPSGTVVLNGTTSVPISSIQLLLALEPFSIVDRYTDVSIPLLGMNFDSDYFKYFLVNGKPVLYVTEGSVSNVYPLFQLQKFNVEKTIKTAIAGVTGQITVADSVIVGPA